MNQEKPGIDTDHRECASAVWSSLQALQTPRWDLRRTTLTRGDYALCNGGKRMLVERKTVQDLQASLHDGRWGTQLHAMTQEGIPCVYILEGLTPEDPPQLWGVVASCITRGTPVLTTTGPQATANTLVRLLLYARSDPEEHQLKWEAKRHSHPSCTSLLAAMLVQVRGVSPAAALALAQGIPNLRALAAVCPTVEALQDRVDPPPRKHRRLNRPAAQRIHEVLGN